MRQEASEGEAVTTRKVRAKSNKAYEEDFRRRIRIRRNARWQLGSNWFLLFQPLSKRGIRFVGSSHLDRLFGRVANEVGAPRQVPHNGFRLHLGYKKRARNKELRPKREFTIGSSTRARGERESERARARESILDSSALRETTPAWGGLLSF
jgi:hypothetical protein